jgi:hypothetical protein
MKPLMIMENDMKKQRIITRSHARKLRGWKSSTMNAPGAARKPGVLGEIGLRLALRRRGFLIEKRIEEAPDQTHIFRLDS